MSEKQVGFKTQLKRGNADGPPETFTAIASIRNVDPPKMSMTIIDSTTLNQTDQFKDKLPGLRDAGQVALQLAFDIGDAGHEGLIPDFVDGTKRNFQIVMPDDGGTVLAFAALVKDFSMKPPLDGLVTADATLEIVGKPTFGAFA